MAKHHTHRNSIARHIPPLDPEALILLLLRRDVLQVHKVGDQRNRPNGHLGWVLISEACLGAAHKSQEASAFRTHILENRRYSHFTPCLYHLIFKEKLIVDSQRSHNIHDLQSSQFVCIPAPCTEDDSLGSRIFQCTEDDNKVVPSIKDKQIIKLADKEMFIHVLHGEDEFGPAAKDFKHREFYVDDGLKSMPSVADIVGLPKAARGMLILSNLHLHKIASNCPAVMQVFPSSEYAKDLKDLDLDIDFPPV